MKKYVIVLKNNAQEHFQILDTSRKKPENRYVKYINIVIDLVLKVLL